MPLVSQVPWMLQPKSRNSDNSQYLLLHVAHLKAETMHLPNPAILTPAYWTPEPEPELEPPLEVVSVSALPAFVVVVAWVVVSALFEPGRHCE